MIVVMRPDHTPEQVQAVMDRLVQFGLQGQPIQGVEREVIAGLGQVMQEHRDDISMMPGVDEVIRVSKPYKLSSREVHPKPTIVQLPNGVQVGGGRPVFMAGPCAIESEDQLMSAARTSFEVVRSSRDPRRTRSRASASTRSSCCDARATRWVCR